MRDAMRQYSELTVRLDELLTAVLTACAAQMGRTVEAEAALACEFYAVSRALADLQDAEPRDAAWHTLRNHLVQHLAEVTAVATGDEATVPSIESRIHGASGASNN